MLSRNKSNIQIPNTVTGKLTGSEAHAEALDSSDCSQSPGKILVVDDE